MTESHTTSTPLLNIRVPLAQEGVVGQKVVDSDPGPIPFAMQLLLASERNGTTGDNAGAASGDINVTSNSEHMQNSLVLDAKKQSAAVELGPDTSSQKNSETGAPVLPAAGDKLAVASNALVRAPASALEAPGDTAELQKESENKGEIVTAPIDPEALTGGATPSEKPLAGRETDPLLVHTPELPVSRGTNISSMSGIPESPDAVTVVGDRNSNTVDTDLSLSPGVTALHASRNMEAGIQDAGQSVLTNDALPFQIRTQSVTQSGNEPGRYDNNMVATATATAAKLNPAAAEHLRADPLNAQAAQSVLPVAGPAPAMAVTTSISEITSGHRLVNSVADAGAEAAVALSALPRETPHSARRLNTANLPIAQGNEPAIAIDGSEVLDVADDNALVKKLNGALPVAAKTPGGNEMNASIGLTDTPNNMLAGLASGTIPAPQLARTDGANTAMTAPYPLPILAPDAEESLSGNLKWMINDGVKNAVINVTPSGMGPISVKVDIENEQMNVSIIASQAGTREALDAMLPRLREQLIQGFDNVRVDVSDGRSENAKGNQAHQQFNQSRGEFSANDQTADQFEKQAKDEQSRQGTASASSENQDGFLDSRAGGVLVNPDDMPPGTAIYDAYV